MELGIVHYGRAAYHKISALNSTCKIAEMLPDGQTLSLWRESLRKKGFVIASPEPTPEDLFKFVKRAFEKQYNEQLDIYFGSGYIASLDGTYPIPSGEASRLYSGRNMVYVDELVLAALFEYIATYYLWAKDFTDEDMFSFCFKYTIGLLNRTCRLGALSSDERRVQLVERIVRCCNDAAIELIADLYWSCLAFAFCHEISHIHLKHVEQYIDPKLLWKVEYEADAVGYDVYLQIIENVCKESNDPFADVFHDYLYIAPMILFQFYEDTYFMSYWLFGEKAGNSHPPLQKRFEALLQISEQPQYTFETKEGNILLNNYMDVSECFREQLILKLQRGKLNRVIQEEFAFMSQSGYREAELFQENMCEDLRLEAEKYGWNAEQIIGLWDTAVDIELLDDPCSNPFVWSHKGKTYSTKAFNVRFSLKKVLTSILELGAASEMPDSAQKAVFASLLILYNLSDVSTKRLTEAQAAVLIKCYELHASERPISEEILLQLPDVSSKTIDELNSLGCIKLDNGLVWLEEKIFIR